MRYLIMSISQKTTLITRNDKASFCLLTFEIHNIPFFFFPVATAEDSPVAMKLKKMWLKTPVGEEQAAQAVLDPAIG